MTAKDLNFDELDKAVTNYMNKPPEPTSGSPTPPLTPVVASPKAEAPASSPAPSEPVVPPSPPIAAAAAAEPQVTASPAPRVQLRSRGTVTPRKSATGGSTFHDIMPAHRRSTVVPAKQIQPLADVKMPSVQPAALATPVPPAKAPLPEEKNHEAPSVPVVSTPVVPVSSEPKPTQAEPEKTPEPVVESPTPSLEVPKILGSSEAEAQKPADPEAQVVPSVPSDTPTPISENGELLKPEPPAVSDALLEDLRKESEASNASEDEQPQALRTGQTASPEAHPSALEPEPPKASNLLADTPLELEEGKEEAPGLLNTGELHQTATPVETSHILDAGNDDEQPMQVFDTKEYHTPITGHDAAPRKSKKWELVIVILVILIVAAAAFVAYMMAFGSAT